MPISVREEDQTALATSRWGAIPNIRGVKVPFGYTVSPEDETVLLPVVFELEALDRAKQHILEGHSLRKVAEWLSEKTGRRITHEGLRIRVRNDRTDKKRADTFRRWAESLSKAVVETYEFDKKFGNDTSWTDEFLATLREKIERKA